MCYLCKDMSWYRKIEFIFVILIRKPIFAIDYDVV